MDRERGVFRHLREKDLDLALIYLFDVSPELFEWFCEKLDIEAATLDQIWHSFVHDGRESDIEVSVKTPERSTIVLIENKISAELQDGQAEAYYDRGESYLSGRWDDFVVCLVAPSEYIDSSADLSAKFDYVIHYESILERIESAKLRSSLSFEPLFRAAIDEAKHPYEHTVDDEKTIFLQYCWRLAYEHYPCLQPKKPESAAGNTWFKINPPSLRNGDLIFKKNQDNVDLQLRKKH